MEVKGKGICGKVGVVSLLFVVERAWFGYLWIVELEWLEVSLLDFSVLRRKWEIWGKGIRENLLFVWGLLLRRIRGEREIESRIWKM